MEKAQDPVSEQESPVAITEDVDAITGTAPSGNGATPEPNGASPNEDTDRWLADLETLERAESKSNEDNRAREADVRRRRRPGCQIQVRDRLGRGIYRRVDLALASRVDRCD